MREFVYFSPSAATTGNFKDLMKAGRMDIAIHSIIAGLFLSHDYRKDTRMHLVFYGMPDPPKHIELEVKPGLNISKKDIATLIKKILYKSKGPGKKQVLPGASVEKKSFLKVIDELVNQGKQIFILDKRGKDLREIDDLELGDNPVFVVGDHEGLPKKELKRLKKIAIPVSIGPKMYFASQTVAIVNNEMDIRGI